MHCSNAVRGAGAIGCFQGGLAPVSGNRNGSERCNSAAGSAPAARWTCGSWRRRGAQGRGGVKLAILVDKVLTWFLLRVLTSTPWGGFGRRAELLEALMLASTFVLPKRTVSKLAGINR